MVHLGLVVLLVLVCIAACMATDEWTAAEYPNPQTHPESCGRGGLKSSVCDPNGVIFSQDGEHFSQLYLTLHPVLYIYMYIYIYILYVKLHLCI